MTVHRLDAIKSEFLRDFPWQQPVVCAATGNVTISTGLNPGDVIDAHTLVAGEPVLLPLQSTGSQNGIWISAAVPYRSEHMCTGLDTLGSVIVVLAGTVNGGKVFKNTNTGPITIDTTALTFAEFGAGTALTIKDEGSSLATAATSIDFVGAGVTASGTGAAKTVTIPGGATTLDGLTDVVIATPLDKQRLRYSTVDSLWHNSSLVWEVHVSYDGTAVLDGAGNPVQTEVTY